VKICHHSILNRLKNFAEFTTLVHLGVQMNSLDFEIKGQGHSFRKKNAKKY